MNKAFVKEPEDTGAAHCPRCGSLGVQVGDETLTAQLSDEDRRNLPETAYFCPFARCEVAYFDLFERTVAVDRLSRSVYPKDPDAPICPCFGFTCDEIEQDLSEGVVDRVRALLAKTKTSDAQCTTKAPSGQCCMPEVQRYYMKRRGGG